MLKTYLKSVARATNDFRSDIRQSSSLLPAPVHPGMVTATLSGGISALRDLMSPGRCA